MNTMKETVLTGLRTNGEYHLGNYIGALKPMIDLTNNKSGEYQVNLFVPDLHSFTTPIEFGVPFYEQTMANLKLYVACGMPLDNASVHMYRQSYIPAHSELAWLFDNFTGFGEMNRMVEFKDKSDKLDSERVSVGLFNYPVLMAADILLYGAKWVPVGDDQRQHLEFTRTIAERLNNQFGELFTLPETVAKQHEFFGRSEAPRIRSLRNPAKKMSKSVADPAGTIMLSDSPAEARKKIMSAETDSIGAVNFDWAKQPGVTNLLVLISALTGKSQADVNSEWSDNERYGDLKSAAADAVCATLEGIQAKLASVDEPALLNHLEVSEAKMNITANAKLLQVQKAIGLRP